MAGLAFTICSAKLQIYEELTSGINTKDGLAETIVRRYACIPDWILVSF
jgi:hypothetical protein